MIDLKNIDSIEKKLADLKENQQPVFGKFTPQHMVEHLAYTVELSYGKVNLSFASKEENLPALRAFLYSDKEIRAGAKAPFLGDDLPDLVCSSLEDAKQKLSVSLTLFHEYYAVNKSSQHMHPVFGMLNYEEWLMFHSKHFALHFKQFELIK